MFRQFSLLFQNITLLLRRATREIFIGDLRNKVIKVNRDSGELL